MTKTDPERERQVLLDVLRTFKPPELSDLDAALNVIINHARTIQTLTLALREIKAEPDKRSAIAAKALELPP